MESSRIFIKGLPPNLTEQDFKKHFSTKSQITDAKLIPNRRIGYVGFKSPEDARKAVAYFNKSFIRMSKIAVEIARPISDPELPVSRKVLREQAREARKNTTHEIAEQSAQEAGLKRKRVDDDTNDAKLQEFLEVMQPASKLRNKPMSNVNEADAERPTKIQALEMPEAESDDEYETVPKIAAKPAVVELPPAADVPEVDTVVDDIGTQDPSNAVVANGAADSSDWLRSHTSRLLDIVDADELPTVGAPQRSEAIQPEQQQIPAAQPTQQDEQPAATLVPGDDSVDDAPVLTDDADVTMEAIKSNGRLFIRNLPYTATEAEVREHLSKYGALEEAHLCLDAAGVSKGFAFAKFEDPDAAAEAFHNLDGEPFQGRLVQILPAAGKRENKLDEFAIAKLPLKKQKEIKKKYEAAKSTFSWNSLYMNQDAINSSMATRLGISKTDLLDPTSSDAGVKQAIAETSIIQEVKTYFKNNGVDLDAFKHKERGDTSILVKNFPFGTSIEEIRTMFEEHGQVVRVLMPPTGTIAIVEFAQAPQARAAYASLAYKRMGSSMLFLEKAPKDLFISPPKQTSTDGVTATATATGIEAKNSVADLFETGDTAESSADTCTLFVRNLNFSTTNEKLASLFEPLSGFLSAKIKTKTDSKKPGQVLSAGFGFLEFASKAEANTALKAMNGYDLDGHKLLIKASHKGADAAEERRKEDRAKKMNNKKTKIIVKNLPFEANKKDIYNLFGTYGKLRSVRMPKKFGGSTRGFAFAEFVSPREAENALESLKSTHLLGRRLVLDFAEEDVLDPEEEIEKMRQKVSKQVDRTAFHKLTGAGRERKKFEIGNEEDQ